MMRVLLTVFLCIKACSNQNELPSYLRVFVNSLQHCVLDVFKKVLTSSPTSLEVFREEGIWDLIFSENFFYFGPASEEISGENCLCNEGFTKELESTPSCCTNSQTRASVTEILQMEIISFVEFAATCDGSVHNLPELSCLLDALEQFACHPEIAHAVAKSLLCILQLSSEKTVASFKGLNAIPRVLKVASIQAKESKKSSEGPSLEKMLPAYNDMTPNMPATVHSCLECMETCMSLFTKFLSIADDARGFVIRDLTCIDCLFNLFWEEGMRNTVLGHILDLMKTAPSSQEDEKAKLHLCSKYFETFSQIKEREKSFVQLFTDLLVGMREMLTTDPEGECFLHVVSLLNVNLDEANGEELVLDVLEILTCLLSSNDSSKSSFRTVVGKGYQTMQSLLLDFLKNYE